MTVVECLSGAVITMRRKNTLISEWQSKMKTICRGSELRSLRSFRKDRAAVRLSNSNPEWSLRSRSSPFSSSRKFWRASIGTAVRTQSVRTTPRRAKKNWQRFWPTRADCRLSFPYWKGKCRMQTNLWWETTKCWSFCWITSARATSRWGTARRECNWLSTDSWSRSRKAKSRSWSGRWRRKTSISAKS